MTTRKNKPPHSASTTSAGNVVHLHETAPAIEPEEGWRLHTPEGMLRFSVNADGRLVLLSELVRWLMDRKELPCGVAVSEVCQALEALPLDGKGLYVLQRGGYAVALTDAHSFWYTPGFFIGTPEPPAPNEYLGFAGALYVMRSYWGQEASPLMRSEEGAYLGAHVLEPLAMRMDMAHRLWGWGKVTAPAVDAVDKPTESEWSPERLWDTLSRFKGDGKKAPMKRLSELSGIPDREIRRLIEPLKAVASSPFGGLFKQSNRGG